MNYAEDNDGDGDGGRGVKKTTAGQQGRRGPASKPAAAAAARGGGKGKEQSSRNTPLPFKDELRRAVSGEKALSDDVRAFRRLVRSAVKDVSGKDFAFHFRDPVDLVSYPQYVELVAEPMDLAKVLFKLRQGEYDSREVGGACGEGTGCVLCCHILCSSR